jgi:hypothetical protein
MENPADRVYAVRVGVIFLGERGLAMQYAREVEVRNARTTFLTLLVTIAVVMTGCENVVVGSGEAAAPVFSPAAGAYQAPQSVTISSTTPGSFIRYTVDGTDPSATVGTLYVEPVAITATTTIRAIASAEGYLTSAISEGAYVIAASAEALVDAAYDLMRVGSWDAALEAFSQALIADPESGEAAIGYAILNIASITVDTDVVGVARDRLGLVGYPTEMGAVLSLDWLVDMQEHSGGSMSGLMPDIAGQDDWATLHGDPSIIDPRERIAALAAFVAAHNATGPSYIFATLSSELSARLQAAIDAIDAVDGSVAMSLDWRMAATGDDSAPPEGWPLDSSGNPVELVLGKAEALTIAAFLGSVRVAAEIAQVYDLTLPIAEYWNSFGAAGNGATPAQKPFSGSFLNLSASHLDHLSAARSAWIEAADHVMEAADMVLADRPGFTLSSSGSWLSPADWENVAGVVEIGKRVALEQKESLVSSRMAIFPKGSVDPDNWPSEFSDPETEIGLNLYLYFEAPVGLSTVLLETQVTEDPDGPNVGEPVFYTVAGGTLRRVTRADIDALGTPRGRVYDFQGDTLSSYLRLKDVTLGGVIPAQNIRMDDPGAGSTFSLSYNDGNADGYWTEGEQVWGWQFGAVIEGPVDVLRLGEYGGDPVSWYGLRDSLLDACLKSPTAEQRQALRDAMEDYGSIPTAAYAVSYFDGQSLYLPGPPIEAVWHAYTTAVEDSAYTDDDPTSLVQSRGSIYWYLGTNVGW